MPSRRQFLGLCAVGAVGALAGCVEAEVAMFVDAVPDDRAIAEQATVDVAERYGLAETDLLDDAVDGGAETTEDDVRLSPDRPVLHRDAVYEVEREVVDTRTRTEYRIHGTVRPAAEVEPEIAFADLPAIDRERLELLDRLSDEAPDDGEDGRERVEVQHHYDEGEREQSVLVPEPEYEVLGREDADPVEISVAAVEAEVDVYRYETTELAASATEFGRRIREAHRFELTGLSEAEREFFEDVVEDRSYVEGSADDEFRDLADRFVERPAIYAEPRRGEWLVRYDGADYWVEIHFVRLSEYEGEIEAVEEVAPA